MQMQTAAIGTKKKQRNQNDAKNSIVLRYIENTKQMSISTATEYKKRLNSFTDFVASKYGYDVDALVREIKKNTKKLDVYEVLSAYIAFLNESGTVSPSTIKQRVTTAKNILEFSDIEISPRKMKFKVKLPRSIRKDIKAVTKGNIIEILNFCSDIRLKTYIMLVSATGMRASEALSIRICDLDIQSNVSQVFVRGEYTKTKADRNVLLTQEVSKQLGNWLEYKYRSRRVAYYDKNTGKSISEIRTPTRNDRDLIFSMNTSVPDAARSPASIKYMYVELSSAFGKTLDRMGMGQRQESPGTKRRAITLHSLRRFVKSTISDLGYQDFSEWYIGHIGSTYYRKSDKEKIEIFKKVEPYLTFLDVSSLDQRYGDMQTRIEDQEMIITSLKERNKTNVGAIVEMQQEIENMKSMMQNMLENVANISDQQQKDTIAKSLFDSKVLKAGHKSNIIEELE